MRFVVVVLVAACHGAPASSATCACTPGEASSIPGALDGEALLGRLRHHRADVAAGRNGRDVKMFDDELRFAVADFCRPCGAWIKDTMRIDEMFPIDRLDDATRAVCMGLVLRDATTVYGSARPTCP
jgi:hypothetical protein